VNANRPPALLHAAGAALIAAAGSTDAASASAAAPCCAVVELRQYALHPGRFEPFNALFEREFIEPQEAAGMTVIGQFHDLDDHERFVWLRGFADMAARKDALEAFYGGALWKSLRDEANANFIDTDNVLLLRPAGADAGFRLDGSMRAAIGAAPASAGCFVATIYAVAKEQAAAFPQWFEQTVRPALVRDGITPVAALETNPAVNNFPRLPVREGETVFVWFARFADRAHADAALRDLAASKSWRATIAVELERRLTAPLQVLRLEPTARSRLR
jgi:hypothetical protein